MKVSVLAILFSFFSFTLHAQQFQNSLNASYAGGGMSISNGLNSVYTNPANIHRNTYGNGHEITFGAFLIQGNPIQFEASPTQFIDNRFRPFLWDSTDTSGLNSIDSRLNQIRNQYAVDLFGFSYSRPTWGISISARTRFLSQNSIDDFWGNLPDFVSQTTFDRSFQSEQMHFNELTIGFSQDLTYINDLTSALNFFRVGISISAILPINYIQSNIDEKYDLAINQKEQALTLTGIGPASNSINQWMNNRTSTWQDNLNSDFFTQTNGLGLGVNLGFEYEIPFVSEYINYRQSKPIKKALRFGFSVTDLGFIELNNSTNLWSGTLTDSNFSTSNYVLFNNPIGNTAVDIQNVILSSAFEELRDVSNQLNNQSKLIYLPTQLHLGFSLEYNWFLIGVDAHRGLNHSLNNSTDLWMNGFAELQIIPFLPLRGGTIFSNNELQYVTSGVGLELWNFELNFSLGYDLRQNENLDFETPNLAAISGLKIRL